MKYLLLLTLLTTIGCVHTPNKRIPYGQEPKDGMILNCYDSDADDYEFNNCFWEYEREIR